MGSLFLLQQIFLTQELNQGLLHCRQILYQLTYQGSPRKGIITPNNASRVLNYPPYSTDISEAKKLDNKAQVRQSVFNPDLSFANDQLCTHVICCQSLCSL